MKSLRLLILLMFMANLSFAQTPSDAPLDALQWRNRVLLVFAPSAAHPSYEELAAHAGHKRDAMQERDLVFVPILEEGVSLLGTMVLSEEAVRRLRTRFDVAPGAFRVFLIGKDGGVKMEVSSAVDLEAVFARIDQMPMRQREVRERGQRRSSGARGQ